MKLFSILTTALVYLAVEATPVPDRHVPRFPQRVTDASAITARDAAAEEVGLAKRAELNCEIVNVVTSVDCHTFPTHASTYNGMNNYVDTSFGPSTKHDFNCYVNGETVGGIT